VKLHRNAKTTPVTRALLVRRIRQQGWLVRDAAAAQSVSVQTAYKWLRRNRDGDRHCEDRSSTPHCPPRRTAPALVAGIVGLRQQRLTAWQIAVRVQVPRSTVAVILARAGRNRVRLLMPPAPVVRYERRRPGELVHVDMKRRGRIARIGHRIHGDRRYRGRGIGWETVHVCVDDHSRAAYVEVLADQQAGTTTAFITRAVRWFARRGVRVERIMTDNGSAYRSHRFRRCCERFGARHLRTRAYRPQTNGKAERFIQTLLREWAYAIPYSSSWRRTRALCPWLRYYNGQRPHTSLSYQSPASRFPRAVQ
jgi:transposase InsO family protein